MPRHFIAVQRYLSIEPNPADPGANPGDSGSGGPSPDPSAAQVAELQSKLQGYENLITKLRGFERQYKSLEAIVGETNPEKLQALRDAQKNLEQQQALAEQAVLKAKTEVSQEYKTKLDATTQQLTTAQQEAEKVRTQFDLFKAFNANGGIGSRFEAFLNLASANFERTEQGTLQVRDDAGTLITATDDKGVAMPVTPQKFIKMLNAGELDNYQFNQREMLQLTLEAYNKSSGAGLPGSNGLPSGGNLQTMSQSELANYAFR